MNDSELKIKEKIYPFTTKILDLVVNFEIIKYYNFIVNEDVDIKSVEKNYRYNNQLKNYKKNKIIVMNHSNCHDFPFINNVLKKHFFILSARENLTGLEGFVINMNGCIPIERNNKSSRKKSADMIKYILSKGYDVLVMVEGTWNLSPSTPILPFSWGIINIARESNVEILPIILEYDYDNKNCFANIGKMFNVNNYSDKKKCYDDLRDYMATLRWNLWELLSKQNQSSVNKEKFEKYVKYLLDEYPKLNYEKEKKILYHAFDSYEEVMEPIKKLCTK